MVDLLCLIALLMFPVRPVKKRVLNSGFDFERVQQRNKLCWGGWGISCKNCRFGKCGMLVGYPWFNFSKSKHTIDRHVLILLSLMHTLVLVCNFLFISLAISCYVEFA